MTHPPLYPRRFAPLLGLGLALLVVAPARGAELALGLRAGTAGFGPEVTAGLSPRVHVRLAGGFLGYETTYDETGIDYDAELELRNALLLLDWHPTAGAFRLSLGAAWNDNELAVSAPLHELVERERPELLPLLPPGPLGSVHGTAAGDSLAPYAGFGWGTPFGDGRWGVTVDVGAFYHGEPEVDLTAELLGLPLSGSTQRLLDQLAEDEERRLEGELSGYTFMPVIAFGLTFRL